MQNLNYVALWQQLSQDSVTESSGPHGRHGSEDALLREKWPAGAKNEKTG